MDNLRRVVKTLMIALIVVVLVSYARGIKEKSEPVVKFVPVKIAGYRVSAYCPCEKCCGKWADGMTASGYKIQPGDRFVAAPSEIPFGTKVIVPGYNNDRPVEVRDRGGAIKGNRLDVFFNDHQEAVNWGIKYLDVRIIEGE